MDIRSRKSREAVENAFLALLRQKPAARITVTELCQYAGINRTTFYKHYLDVQDLQGQLENGVLQDFACFLQSGAFSGDGRYRAMLLQMLEYMRRHSSRFYLLCSGNAGSELPARAFQLVNDYAFPLMRQHLPGAGEEKAELVYQFLTRGCGAVLASWLRGESTMGVEEMAEFIMRISGAAVDAVAQEG